MYFYLAALVLCPKMLPSLVTACSRLKQAEKETPSLLSMALFLQFGTNDHTMEKEREAFWVGRNTYVRHANVSSLQECMLGG